MCVVIGATIKIQCFLYAGVWSLRMFIETKKNVDFFLEYALNINFRKLLHVLFVTIGNLHNWTEDLTDLIAIIVSSDSSSGSIGVSFRTVVNRFTGEATGG